MTDEDKIVTAANSFMDAQLRKMVHEALAGDESAQDELRKLITHEHNTPRVGELARLNPKIVRKV